MITQKFKNNCKVQLILFLMWIFISFEIEAI